nr:4679_t:CDS:2 [Entrophospora candida]
MSNFSSTSAGVDLNNISNWLHLAGIKKDFVLVSDFDIKKSVHSNLGKVEAVLVVFMDEVESR